MILKACAMGIIFAFLGFLLSELGFGGKKIFTVLSIVFILSFLASSLSGIVGEVGTLAELGGVGEAAKCSLKILFLGYVFGISSDVCAELGENGVANALSLVGRGEIILLVMPYVRDVVNLGVGLIK